MSFIPTGYNVYNGSSTYTDLGSLVSTSVNTLNMTTKDQIYTKKAMCFGGATSIKSSNINISINGVSNIGAQTFTFGKAIQGRWIAGGQFSGTVGNSMATSYDGVNWMGLSGSMSIFSSSVNAIAWNGTMWCAVGSGTNTTAYAYFDLLWTGGSGSGFTAGYGIAWNGTLWVAVGNGTNAIAYSYDGINWIGVTTTTIFLIGYGVAWNGIKWIAVGQSASNSFAYSADGISWTGAGGTIFSTQGNAVAWNGTLWVAVGKGTSYTIAYSSDGITWTGVTSSTSIFTTQGNSVCWNGSIWNAVGNNAIAYSIDGITWNISSTTVFSDASGGLGISFNGKLFVACGKGGNNIAYSYNGVNWIGLGVKNVFSNSGCCVAWNARREHSIKIPANMVVSPGKYGIGYSFDGINWTLATGSSAIYNGTYNVASVAYNGKLWIATGSCITTPFLYSYDGVKWFGITAPNILGNGNGSNGIAWNGTMWIAVGSGGTYGNLAYSYDGINWTGVNVSALFSANINGIAWNGKLWVVGANGTNSLGYSYDGINWKAGTCASGITNNILGQGYQMVWNGLMWIAVGYAQSTNNTILYSYDGIFWTAVNSIPFTGSATGASGYGVAWNGTLWVAVGQTNGTPVYGAIAYSYNGINWTGVTGASTIFTSGGLVYGVVWNGKLWIAVGTATNTIAYSYDGINWTGLGNIIYTQGTAVGSNTKLNSGSAVAIGSVYVQHPTVAVGYSTPKGTSNPLLYSSLAYSMDGITWKMSNPGIFTTAGRCVAWNGIMWVAGGNGTNTIAYSYDGISWTGSTSANSIFTQVNCILATNLTNPVWIAGGSGTFSMAYSNDGINWKGISSASTLSNTILGIAWNNVKFVAVGSGILSKVMYSTDGINWTNSSSGTTIFTGASTCVTYTFNSYWVAGGYATGPTALIAYSSDAITWTSVTITGIIAKSVNCVACNNNIIIAGGSDNTSTSTIAYSTNSTSWTASTSGKTTIPNNCASVAWNGVRWIAGDGSTTSKMAYSNDGIQWYNIPYDITNIINGGVYGIGSNPQVGPSVFPSKINIRPNSMYLERMETLEFVASDGYYQGGYKGLSVSCLYGGDRNIIYPNTITGIPISYTVTQTGATVTTNGIYTLYTFTSSGTFSINNNMVLNTLIVAGGGSGGGYGGGVGGAGGGAGGVGIGNINYASGTSYTVTVGAGGTAIANNNAQAGNKGSNSSIVGGTINEIAYGGGTGAGASNNLAIGGSSGGMNGCNGTDFAQPCTKGVSYSTGSSAAITYYGNVDFGIVGVTGTGNANPASGGGGAGGQGNYTTTTSGAVNGGSGIQWPITQAYYGGGGSGSGNSITLASNVTGGIGGGGNGYYGGSIVQPINATANTGGGGGGATTGNTSGNGGSGVVIIAVPNY